MKQREGPLELDKNLGKTMVVQNSGNRGPGVPGFYCEACNRTYKDSAGYLDHINGRAREYRLSLSSFFLLLPPLRNPSYSAFSTIVSYLRKETSSHAHASHLTHPSLQTSAP